MSISLDGFIAPEGMDLTHADDPNYKHWMSQWMALQQWVFPQRFFRENLKLGDGGETGRDNQILEETFNRTGVSIMGKRMFDGGERFWPEEAPFHTPVFVLTNQVRSPWERPGNTTFHFVSDGIESALKQARAVAGGGDIRIAGGANVVLQYLNTGLIDEFSLALAPVFIGEGIRLFGGIDRRQVSLEVVEAMHSPLVTHLRYAVKAARAMDRFRASSRDGSAAILLSFTVLTVGGVCSGEEATAMRRAESESGPAWAWAGEGAISRGAVGSDVLMITPHELNALRMLADGTTTQTIASRLGMRVCEADAALRSLFARLGAASRREALAVAMRRGLLG